MNIFDTPTRIAKILLFFVRKTYKLNVYYCEYRTAKTYHYKVLWGSKYLVKLEEKHDYDC